MAVDAVYLFDEKMRIRRAVVWGLYQLIHDEATHELDAEIDAKYEAKPGEFLGFLGVDNQFLFFEIDKSDNDDKRGVLVITATYAPVKELSRLIVREIRLTDATAQEAGEAALKDSGWTLDASGAGDRKAPLSKYFETRWKSLKEIAIQWQLRVLPRYTFDGVQITGKIVELTQRGNVYRGRLFEGARGTSQIYITRSGSPVTRLYAIGKATGTEDPPTCVTFKDVVWSVEDGDPADKPAGQDYIEDAEAIALYGHGREDVYNDKNTEDPEQLLEDAWEELQRLKRPKVSGTATSSDMEHLPGYEHMIARMYDLVWVRTKHGEDVSAVIINVKRNYLRRGLTKIYIGEEPDDSGLIKKIAGIDTRSKNNSRSNESQSNRFILTRQLIQLNADTIQANARYIEANAELIRLTASNLKEFEDGTDERLTMAELTLYGDGTSAGAGLVAKVQDHDSEISRAALTLYGDESSATAGLVAKVGENAASITAQATEIGSLVQIKADRTEIEGLVTAEELSAEVADIEKFFAGNATAAKMIITNLGAISLNVSTEFSFEGIAVDWQSGYMVRSQYLPNYEYVNLMRGDGSTGFYYVFHDRPTVNVISKNYLGDVMGDD